MLVNLVSAPIARNHRLFSKWNAGRSVASCTRKETRVLGPARPSDRGTSAPDIPCAFLPLRPRHLPKLSSVSFQRDGDPSRRGIERERERVRVRRGGWVFARRSNSTSRHPLQFVGRVAIHATPLRVVFNGGWWGLSERYRGGCDDTAGRERTTGWPASWMVRRLVGWFAWVRGCVVAPPLSFLREFVSRKGALSRRATAPQETYTCHPVVRARNTLAGQVIRDRLFSFFLSFVRSFVRSFQPLMGM